MRALVFAGTAIFATAMLLGCPGSLESPERFAVHTSASATPDAFECDVPALLVRHCGPCHASAAPSSGLVLDDAAALDTLFGKPAMGGLGVLIQPGAPEESVLWQKMTWSSPPFGTVMPPSRRLAAEETACVRSWIETLKPNDGGPPSDGPMAPHPLPTDAGASNEMVVPSDASTGADTGR